MPSGSNNHRPVSYVALARTDQGLSQRTLAALSGMTQVGISHIESGRVRKPHTLSQQAIAAALGYEARDLFPPPGKPSPSNELRTLAQKAER